MIRTSWRAIATALVAALVAGAAPAQAETAAPPAAEAVPAPKPESIPLPEIMGRAAQADEELRQIAAAAAEAPVVTGISAELPKARESIDADAAESFERLEGSTQIRNLGDLENRWSLERRNLEAWAESLTASAREIEGRVERLAALDEIWMQARDEMRTAKAPPAVFERIDVTRKALAAARKAVEARRDEVLGIQAEIAELIDVVSGVQARIDAERGRISRHLLGADAPPLWTMVAQGMTDATTRERELRELVRDFAVARDYVGKRGESIAAQALLIALGAGLLLLVRRRAAGRSDDDPELQAHTEVLSRPYSCAILIGVAFTPLLFRAAPGIVVALIGLIALGPILRLIPPLLDPSAMPTFRALVALFLVDRVRLLIVPAVALERLVYVCELCFAVYFFARLLRRDRLDLISSGTRFPPFAGTLIRLAVGALIVAVGANVLGSTDLSLMLGQGVLRCAYGAVGFFAMYRVASGVAVLALNSAVGRRLNMVRRHRALIVGRTLRLLRAGAILVWLSFSLGNFDIRDEFLTSARSLLTAGVTIGELTVSLGSVVSFGIVLTFAVYFSRLLRFVLEEDVLPRMRLARGVPYAVTATLHYTILFLGLMAAFVAMGIDMGKFSILAGALGVGVGFGLQNVVSNFVSGLILLFERPIQTGDVVEVGPLLGVVRRIGIRASTVRTLDGAEVIVPNANLISDQVVNWTLSDRQRRIEVSVGVKYGTDPELVQALLLEVATANDKILTSPAPDALFQGFGDSSLNFKLRAWTADYERWVQVSSDLNVAVNRALKEAAIEIPFPQRDLHVRSISEGAAGALKPPRAGD